jgi:uncharacterized paraquat-inducible protein A
MDWETIETGVWWSFGNMYYDQNEEPCFYCTYEEAPEDYEYCPVCGRELDERLELH